MTVTVWWKSGMDSFSEFTDIVETYVSEFSKNVIVLHKDDNKVIYINVNEVMYVEEEEEETE
jgi:hypothetical protein